MGLPINIDDVLAGRSVEWERLEFKEGWNPEAVLHTLCAFANDFHNLDGGYIIVGVAEKDGQAVLPPVGLPMSSLDAAQKKLEELGRLIQPTYHPITEPYVVQERHILVLRASGGQNRPYKAPISLTKGEKAFGYYIRRNSCTVKAGVLDEADLFSLAAKIPYDDRIRQNASLSDLDMALVTAHLKSIKSSLANEVPKLGSDEIARKMNIADGPPENLRPRNVGLMFFNEHPEDFFPQTQIDVVQFPDGPGGDTHFEKIFRGPVSRQLKEALEYIKSNIIKTYVIKHSDRAEADRVFNYPYPAIEEILVNAAYHRSYEDREPIEVRVLPDHMTITSYPGPDRSISLDDLKSGKLVARRYRNRRIGEFLKELSLTEGRGTGIPTAIRSMAENGSPKPEFQTDEGRTYFTAVLPVRAIVVEPLPNNINDTIGSSTYAERMAERTLKTLTFLNNNGRITRGTYMDMFTLSETQAKRDINYFIDMGWIERRGASVNIHYALTNTGQQRLAELKAMATSS